MADNLMTLDAERWSDIVLLVGTKLNIDGDQNDTWVPPLGLGDVALLELMVQCSAILTLVLTPETIGLKARVVNAAFDRIIDIIGVERFTKVSATELAAYVSPDPLVLIRSGERIAISFPELDTNAAPTGDLAVYAKCVRVKPVEGPPGPLRLVR